LCETLLLFQMLTVLRHTPLLLINELFLLRLRQTLLLSLILLLFLLNASPHLKFTRLIDHEV
jgi:hypothetical protein